MNLSSPFIITPRLCAGLQIGDVFISIEYSAQPGESGRTRYTYHIDKGSQEHTSSDLQSGCGSGTLQAGMESLLSFLCAAGEAWNYQERTGRESDNTGMFPDWVCQWASQADTELSMLQIEIEESPIPLLTE